MSLFSKSGRASPPRPSGFRGRGGTVRDWNFERGMNELNFHLERLKDVNSDTPLVETDKLLDWLLKTIGVRSENQGPDETGALSLGGIAGKVKGQLSEGQVVEVRGFSLDPSTGEFEGIEIAEPGADVLEPPTLWTEVKGDERGRCKPKVTNFVIRNHNETSVVKLSPTHGSLTAEESSPVNMKPGLCDPSKLSRDFREGRIIDNTGAIDRQIRNYLNGSGGDDDDDSRRHPILA